MSALAPDGDVEPVRGGGQRTGADAELAGGIIAGKVASIKLIYPLHYTGLIQFDGAAGRQLLGVLEDTDQFAAEFLAMAGSQYGSAQQHGGVPVMAAGMHHAWGFRAKRQLIAFRDGQGVDIRADGNGPARPAAPDAGHQAGLGGPGDLNVLQFLQLRLNVVGGGKLLERELGVLMEMTAPCDHLGEEFIRFPHPNLFVQDIASYL